MTHPTTAPQGDDARQAGTDLARLAEVGEIARPLAHEFNNFLNVLLLNVAILEQTLPGGGREELKQIRRQGLAAAELVREFQQYWRRAQGPSPSVDLGATLADALAALASASPDPGRVPLLRAAGGAADPAAGPAVAVQLDLEPGLPPVRGSGADLRRLADFLLTNAAAAAATRPEGRVGVQARRDGAGVLLRVEDSGPEADEKMLSRLFEPSVPGREGVRRLELAACKGIVQRWDGRIAGERSPLGGVAVVVWLAAGE